MKKVIDEVLLMYQEADAPLPFLHLGGDEVPTRYGPIRQQPCASPSARD